MISECAAWKAAALFLHHAFARLPNITNRVEKMLDLLNAARRTSSDRLTELKIWIEATLNHQIASMSVTTQQEKEVVLRSLTHFKSPALFDR
jgi:hypothetical protein